MPVDLERLDGVIGYLAAHGMIRMAGTVADAIVEIREHRARLTGQPPQAIESLRNAEHILRRYGEIEVASTVHCVVEVLATPMRASSWTKEKPTVPGWYWVRDEFDRSVGNTGDVVYLGIGGINEETGEAELWAQGGSGLDPGWEYSPILEPPRGEPQVEGSE
jgi:hypothetical protein